MNSLTSPLCISCICLILSLASTFSAPANGQTKGAVPLSNPATRRAPKKDAVNHVVIVCLDALRADRLEAYGNKRPCSPRISRIAGRGATFLHAFSAATWTLPSFTSIFTSLYPSRHGFLYMHDDTLPLRLKDSEPTLIKTMRDNGFFTQAIVGKGPLSTDTGLMTGFQSFDVVPIKQFLPLQKGMEWIPLNAGKPFLLLLHTYDPHSPYTRTSFSESYDPTYSGRIKYGWTGEYKELSSEAKQRGHVLDAEHRQILARYDGRIAAADQWVGSLFDTLEKLNLVKNTLFILTSDHGEHLLDRGFRIDHGTTVYPELTNIPLIMTCPSKIPKGAKVNAHVSSIDIAPTILDAVGLRVPESMEGISLLPLIKGTPAPSRDLFAEVAGDGKKVCVISNDGYRYIFTILGDKRELYNIKTDPTEQHDIIREHPDTAEKLHGEIEDHLRKNDRGYYLVVRPENGNSPWRSIRIKPVSSRLVTAWSMDAGWTDAPLSPPYSWDTACLEVKPVPGNEEYGFYFITEPDTNPFLMEFAKSRTFLKAPSLFLGDSATGLPIGRAMKIRPEDCVCSSTPRRTAPGVYLFRYSKPGMAKGGPTSMIEPLLTGPGHPPPQDLKERRDALRTLGYIH